MVRLPSRFDSFFVSIINRSFVFGHEDFFDFGHETLRTRTAFDFRNKQKAGQERDKRRSEKAPSCFHGQVTVIEGSAFMESKWGFLPQNLPGRLLLSPI